MKGVVVSVDMGERKLTLVVRLVCKSQNLGLKKKIHAFIFVFKSSNLAGSNKKCSQMIFLRLLEHFPHGAPQTLRLTRRKSY